MKASKKRAARHKRAAFAVKAVDQYGRYIKASSNDDRLMAVIAINKVARLSGRRLNWDTITVSPN
jgi:hypothetical protein